MNKELKRELKKLNLESEALDHKCYIEKRCTPFFANCNGCAVALERQANREARDAFWQKELEARTMEVIQ